MWIMFSCLISRQSRISCQCHVRKIRILLIFHELMIWEKNNNNINKSNTKWFTSKLSCCSVFYKKNLCVLTENCCVLLVLIFPDLVWCWCHIIKQIFHAFFCLISKLFTLSNIIFNSTSRRWILIIQARN